MISRSIDWRIFFSINHSINRTIRTIDRKNKKQKSIDRATIDQRITFIGSIDRSIDSVRVGRSIHSNATGRFINRSTDSNTIDRFAVVAWWSIFPGYEGNCWSIEREGEERKRRSHESPAASFALVVTLSEARSGRGEKKQAYHRKHACTEPKIDGYRNIGGTGTQELRYVESPSTRGTV